MTVEEKYIILFVLNIQSVSYFFNQLALPQSFHGSFHIQNSVQPSTSQQV